MRGSARRLCLALLACLLSMLGLASTAAAFSVAPKAVEEHGCVAGAECVTEQPATPAWLTLSGGEALLTQQSLDGTAADEYGTNAEADTTLYGSAQPYGTHPASSASVLSATVANLAGTTSAPDTYAVLLRSDRTLEVLGPQSSGYPLAVSVSVPEAGSLVGVVALAAPAGSELAEQLIVITDAGFYIYDWAAGNPPTLTLQAGAPVKSLSGEEAFADVSIAGDPAFTCPVSPLLGEPAPGDCQGGYTGSYTFAPPEGSQLLGVYQAPIGKGEYDGAASTFAIAYTGSDLGGVSESYTVSFFAYEPDGHLHLIDQVQERFAAGSVQPVEVRYASSRTYLRSATLQPAGGGEYRMSSYDARSSSYGSPASAASAASCAAPSAGGLPALAVDAIESESGKRSTGVSFCAAIRSGKVLYQMQRTDHGGEGLASRTQEESSIVSTPPVGSFEAPSGVTPTSIDVTLDLPCDEYLRRFAENPTPDGFPEVGGEADYCAPVKEGAGRPPMEPFFGAAGNVAAQIQYVGEEEGGKRSLLQHSIAYEPEVHTTSFAELVSEPKAPSSQYDERLITLSGPASGLTMLPLGTAMIRWNGFLITGGAGEVVRRSATASPVPVAVLAAPPYYTGAEQQVTPTAVTFSNSECGGSKSEQENSVGIEAGIDAEFAKIYEVEALAKAEYAWSTETAIDTCKSFDQQFISGNFSNNFVAQNSLLFRVDTGTDTYLNLQSNSLGVGLTSECDSEHLGKCYPVFDPTSSEYGIQTIAQLRKPQPNNAYAADDRTLENYYGESLESLLPNPGNPASYPPITSGTAYGCASPPQGPGSGNPGISEYNPFVAPTKPEPPNGLKASQASEVNPASAGNQAGTSSTLSYDSSTEESASAEFKVGAEVSFKAGFFKGGVEYSHGWGSEVSQTFQTGTEFTGGVYDFNGFYNPYSYQLYECKASLRNTFGVSGAGGVALPVFLVDYMTEGSTDGLPLNFVTTSGSLPEGTQGQEYAGQVFASGGSPPYSYSIVSGALPPGLSLDEKTGEVSGTPTEAGTFPFTVRATDSLVNISSESETITIRPPLGILPTLPGGEVGQPYEQSLGATGGQPPYTYLLTSGPLPPGLAVNSTTGMLQGTPEKTGTYCFNLYVADSALPQDTAEAKTCVSIGDTLSLTPESLPSATVGQPYRLVVEGSGGNVGGYVYSSTGTMPLGLGLVLEGSIAAVEGTPEKSGTYTFTVDLNDGEGGHAERTYTLTVAETGASGAQAPSFKSSAAASADVGVAAIISIEGEGAPAPVITLSGTLPEGMSFSGGAAGQARIEGTPAAGSSGTYTVTLTAQNGVEPAATQTLTITVDELPTITTQPADQTAVAPDGSASFTAVASGEPVPTVTWEESIDGGVSWSPLPTALSDTLELSGLEAVDNGEEYRAKFSNSQGSITTDVAKLTVDFAPVIESQPADVTAIEGSEAQFAAAASGQPAPAVQWQVSTDGGETWTDISEATTPVLVFKSVSTKDQGNRYRAVFTNLQGTMTTQAATLTVQTPPQILSEPVEQTVTAGASASFHASAGGDPAPSVQWMLSTDGGVEFSPIKGASSETLTLEGVSASENGNRYVAVFTNPAGEVTTTEAALNVQIPPAVTLQPVAATIAAGANATFAAAASGRPSPTVQWQLSLDGGRTWSDISGATSPSLALLDVPAADNGQLYRAVFTSAAGSATTKPAALTVQTAPGLSASPSGTVATPGGSATFTVSASGSPPPSIQWEVSEDGGETWVVIPGATASTLQLQDVSSSQSGFLYRAIVSNAQGTVITMPVTLIVRPARSAGASGKPGSGKGGHTATCRRAPSHMVFLNRRLGRVVRYTVFVDGRRVRITHGRNLRYAKLPKLGAGWHAVRIVAVTVRGFRITTRRLYVECVKGIGVNKVRRRVRHRRVHRHAHRHG